MNGSSDAVFLEMLSSTHTATELVELMELTSIDIVTAFQYTLLEDEKYTLLRTYISDVLGDDYNE